MFSAGAATQLVFTTEPVGYVLSGTAFSTQPVVTIEDANGNTVTSSTDSIQLAITSGTGYSGATLSCTTNPLAAVSGVAQFAGCSISAGGISSSYTLTASYTGLTSVVSSTFTIY